MGLHTLRHQQICFLLSVNNHQSFHPMDHEHKDEEIIKQNTQMNQSEEYSNIPDIITLNVGGRRFVTTKNTLFWIQDTFFTALLSGRIPSYKDNTGAFFLDRDPDLFTIILNYLRTNKLCNVNENNIDSLKHEAEFFGLTPLIQKFKLYQKFASNSSCGGNIFQSLLKTDLQTDSDVIKQIVSFDNGFAVVFNHYVQCYRFSNYNGWQCVFASEFIPNEINLIDFYFDSIRYIIAIYSSEIIVWDARPSSFHRRPKNVDEIGRFSLKNYPIDSMFFMGSQLVALSKEKGRVGIWNKSRGWFVQVLKQNNTVSVITAFDKTEYDYLFLCSNDGVIYLIDIQKFPLRLKDGDLLINEFYKDPENEEITAISCYHCSRELYLNDCRESFEMAYGTKSGTVRILVHHPETVGKGPLLFKTIQVHLSEISRIMLNDEYLITMCNKLHVRTWSLVRFRDLLSSQPGTKPLSSFQLHFYGNNENQLINVGPYGPRREGNKQVFVEMPYNNCKYANILYASNGQKICTLNSVDDSRITNVRIIYNVHYRQFIVTGHDNGNIQIWDLTSAMELQDTSSQTTKSKLIDDLFNNEC